MKLVKYIENLIFHKRIIDEEVQKQIVEKFNNGTIATEKLVGNLHGKLSFRLDNQARVLSVILPYQGNNSLVVLDLLMKHEYDRCQTDSGLENINLDDKVKQDNWKVITKDQQAEQADTRDKRTAPGVTNWSIETDTICALDAEQLAILEQSNDRPMVMITGVAGSGKTLIAECLMAQAREQNPASKILYVTQSENLVDSVKKQCEFAGSAADLKTFKALCSSWITDKIFDRKDTSYGAETIANAHAIIEGNKAVAKANSELYDYIYSKLHSGNNFIKQHKENTRQLYQDICKRHNSNNFKELGVKSLINDRQVIEKKYLFYKEHLKKNRCVDLSLMDFPEENKSEYDCILIDESQDFVGSQLRHLHSLLKENGRIYFFIDTNQSIEDDFNLVNDNIKELATSQKKDITKYILKRGYRNSKNIIALANRMLQCGRVLVGGMLPSGLRTIEEVEGANLGHIEWFDIDVKDTASSCCERLMQQNPSTLAMVIVVPGGSEQDKKLAKTLFPHRMIFTPEEIKGLEFNKIALFNFFTKQIFPLEAQTLAQMRTVDWINDDKENRPKNTDNSRYNRPARETFVGVTRAREAVYIIQNTQDNISALFKEKIFGDILDKKQVDDIASSDASIEEICQYLEDNLDKLDPYNVAVLCEEALGKVDKTADDSSVHYIKKVKKILGIEKLKESTDELLINRITNLIEKTDSMLGGPIPCRHGSRHAAMHGSEQRLTSLLPSPTKSLAKEESMLPDSSRIKPARLGEKAAKQQPNSSSVSSPAINQTGTQRNYANNILQVNVKNITDRQINAIREGETGLYTWLNERSAEIENLTIDQVRDFCKKIGKNGIIDWHYPRNSALPVLSRFEKHHKLLLNIIRSITIPDGGLDKLGADGFPLVFHYLHIGGSSVLNQQNKQVNIELYKFIQTLDIDVYNSSIIQKCTLLHLATVEKNFDLIKYSVAQKIDINAINIYNKTALDLSLSAGTHPFADNKKRQITEFLLANDADFGGYNINNYGFWLKSAVQYDFLDMIQLLVKKNYVNIKAPFKRTDGITPLCLASMLGYLPIVKYIVNQGVNIDVPDGVTGLNALQAATRHKRLEVVKYLESLNAVAVLPDITTARLVDNVSMLPNIEEVGVDWENGKYPTPSSYFNQTPLSSDIDRS